MEDLNQVLMDLSQKLGHVELSYDPMDAPEKRWELRGYKDDGHEGQLVQCPGASPAAAIKAAVDAMAEPAAPAAPAA